MCREQMNYCLECANFCTGRDNIHEYEEETRHVKEQLEISKRLGRKQPEVP